jgi:hypothetical protein
MVYARSSQGQDHVDAENASLVAQIAERDRKIDGLAKEVEQWKVRRMVLMIAPHSLFLPDAILLATATAPRKWHHRKHAISKARG